MTKSKIPTLVKNDSIDNVLVGFTDSTLKSVALLGATIMFAAPAFATQATPQNILGLADLFFNYMTNRVEVKQPETPAASAEATFG